MGASIRVLLLLLLTMMVGCASRVSCKSSPEFFCTEFREIEQWIGAKELAALESKFERSPAEVHFRIGQDLRNRLQLWLDNDLTRFFRSNGVVEPEKMSYGITVGLEKYRRGEYVDMALICNDISAPLPPPPPPPVPH